MSYSENMTHAYHTALELTCERHNRSGKNLDGYMSHHPFRNVFPRREDDMEYSEYAKHINKIFKYLVPYERRDEFDKIVSKFGEQKSELVDFFRSIKNPSSFASFVYSSKADFRTFAKPRQGPPSIRDAVQRFAKVLEGQGSRWMHKMINREQSYNIYYMHSRFVVDKIFNDGGKPQRPSYASKASSKSESDEEEKTTSKAASKHSQQRRSRSRAPSRRQSFQTDVDESWEENCSVSVNDMTLKDLSRVIKSLMGTKK
jgi:hypothetical protein